jgi:hypothetical protein
MNQLRALIFVPIEWELPSSGNLDASETFPELRPTVLQESGWLIGPLENLDQSGIPSAPFNRLIYFDLPPKLRNFHGYLADNSEEISAVGERKAFRASVNLIANPVKTAIDGVYCEAIEFFGFPLTNSKGQMTSQKNLIAMHLVANDVPANLENFISLTRLWNMSLMNLLSSVFITPASWLIDDSTSSTPSNLPNYHDVNMANGGKSLIERVQGLRWRIPKEITKMNCVIIRTGETSDFRIDGGNLFITSGSTDKEIARFRTKGVFLGALIALLKAQSDIIQSSWPVLLEKSDSEVIETRAWLEQFMNEWWWKRISGDEFLQAAYLEWTTALSIEETLEACREDLKEYWAIRTMQHSLAAADRAALDLIESEKLNKLARIFAVFGIIPAWLGLILAGQPSYIGITIAVGVLLALLIKPKAIMNLVERLQNRIKPD